MKQERQEKYIVKQENLDNNKHQQWNPWIYCLIHWVLFILAFGIYIVVWAINKYGGLFAQTSNYYVNSYAASTSAQGNAITNSITLSAGISLTSAIAVALPLIYSWMLYKFPLIIFSYNIIEAQENKILRFVSSGVFLFILLALDILLFIFVINVYSQWIYYGCYFILTIILAIVNRFNMGQIKEAIKSSTIPLVLFAFFYTCHNFFFPPLLNVQFTNLSGINGLFLWFYLYPILDLILYSLLLVGNYFTPKQAKIMMSTLQFQLIGYGAGMILLTGYTQVEFYYLLGYFIFRNIFVNWIVWKFDDVVNNSPCLPGWGIVYYVSYLLNFVPLIGVGRLVISLSYFSYIWSFTSTLLYGTPNTQYPYTTFAVSQINLSFSGSIFWLSAAIIWLGMTVTQKYSRRKVQWKDFFYYLIGIYFFYQGISSALVISQLRVVSIP